MLMKKLQMPSIKLAKPVKQEVSEMSVKRFITLLSAILIILALMLPIYADGGAVLSQVYSREQNMDIFIAGDMNADNLSVKVANRSAEVLESGLLTDCGGTVRTTVLVDISTSIPLEIREPIKKYIGSIIENIGANEEMRIATFGEKITVLHDFTNDRYDLSTATSDINFDNSQSMIYDAVYNTIPELTVVDNKPCYYRTIVITDGVDVTKTGITKEELLLKLQNDTYPINVIEASKAKVESENKDLASLARVSGGAYANLYPDCDMSSISSAFSTDGIFLIRVLLPGELLDGSTRQINIDDGINSIQFDSKLPLFDVPESEITTAPEVTEPVETESEVIVTEPVETEPETKSFFEEYKIVIIIAAAIIAVILLAVIISAVVNGKKKKGKVVKNKVSGNLETECIRSDDVQTEFLSEEEARGILGCVCISIKNMSNTLQTWDFPLNKDLTIGRDRSCRICISEPSMSRRQCIIRSDLTIENVSNSNVTLLNGNSLTIPNKLSKGDIIKCGRITLSVENIYSSELGADGSLNKLTEFVRL